MKLFNKEISRHKLLYGGLITTFAILYGATAFVSWYHAITFFNIANAVWLSVILSFVAEIGQASALFSLLLTENKNKFLTWFVMIILTSLQVVGNVVSSYDWIIKHNSAGVDSFQQSILFWMNTADPQIFKVVIAWISGALLPIIALSMTALVAQNMDLSAHDAKTKLDIEPADPKDFASEVVKIHPTNEELDELAKRLNGKKPIEKVPPEDPEIPFVGETSLVDIGKLVDNGKVIITKEEKKTDDGWRVKDGKLHPDHQKFLDEQNAKLSEAMPPEDPKEEIPPVIPHYSDEELNEMFMDEYERNGEYFPDEYDELDKEAERLTPEHEKFVEEQSKINESLISDPNETQDVIEPMVRPTEPISDDVITAEDAKRKEENEKLERLRAIARENLKKK